MKKRVILLGLALVLNGCATIDSMPKPIFDSEKASKSVVSRYDYDLVLTAMSKMDDVERKAYRNRVLTAWLMALDSRYFDFRRDLSRNYKLGNIGFDFLLLGLTGAASVWGKAADDLASVATVTAGAKATVNRELYFEKTLPALISLMEAQRLQVRSEIIRGMSMGESVYTMEEGFADITRYQSAASIDGAIQLAAEIAAGEAQKARYDFTKAVDLCEADDVIAAARKNLMIKLAKDRDKDEDGRKQFAKAAVAAGLGDAAASKDEKEVERQTQAIGDFLRGICSEESLDQFKAAAGIAG